MPLGWRDGSIKNTYWSFKDPVEFLLLMSVSSVACNPNSSVCNFFMTSVNTYMYIAYAHIHTQKEREK